MILYLASIISFKYFFSSLDLINTFLNDLFKTQCPKCNKIGNLNRHSKIYRRGKKKDEVVEHGQRVFCSNRNKKEGCKHTFSLNITLKLPRLHRFTKPVNDFILEYIKPRSAINSWSFAFPDCNDITAPYRFLRLVKNAFMKLRALLCILKPPPDKFHENEHRNLFLHMQNSFSNEEICLEALILHLQQRIF
jgi:hypothetical protein